MTNNCLSRRNRVVTSYPCFIMLDSRGKIPKAWKIGTVAAIYKNKGNIHAAENYRPIILTSIAWKILESIVRESLMSFLKANNILSDKQFGFRGGRSTVLQLHNVVDHWSKILDNGEQLMQYTATSKKHLIHSHTTVSCTFSLFMDYQILYYPG